MNRLPRDIILPSSAMTISSSRLKHYKPIDMPPRVGDLAYGIVTRIGQHFQLENKQGRIHNIQHGSKAVFVFGNRYAPDFYEGLMPKKPVHEVDLLARSGLVGIVISKSSLVIDPTRVELLGYVCDHSGAVINTLDLSLIHPKTTVKRFPRAKMILVCGTSMNSGKSKAATACVWALASIGFRVRGSKITGTASLKDILMMNDAGARPIADFTYLGFPSTYLADEADLLKIFNTLDLKYANNPKNFWIVEIADGLNQRETAFLLKAREIRERIHKFVFCARDALGAIGGLAVLRDEFGLVPDAISGTCSSSPLHVKEIQQHTQIPVFDSLNINRDELKSILTARSRQSSSVPLSRLPSHQHS
ncbi:MAG: hypothetical protein ABH879_06740 [archaeon]